MRYLILALFVGCAPLPYSYGADCIVVDSEIELNEFVLERYVQDARRIFEYQTGEPFCKYASEASYTVVSTQDFECFAVAAPDGRCDGFTTITKDIKLGNRGLGLLHEVFHLWDFANGRAIESGTHVGWDKNGFDDSSDQFIRITREQGLWLMP